MSNDRTGESMTQVDRDAELAQLITAAQERPGVRVAMKVYGSSRERFRPPTGTTSVRYATSAHG